MTEPAATAARAAHWDATYAERGAGDLSWFQPEPTCSLALVDALDLPRATPIIDVGGGASTLVDSLIARGFADLTVLDTSAVALDLARARVGAAAGVHWITADVLSWSPSRPYGLWHDRAAFHFLTDDADRAAYLEVLRATVPHGVVILATFAPDGPETCSGLPVARYSANDLADLLHGFRVVDARRDLHVTPWGTTQPFTFLAARRR